MPKCAPILFADDTKFISLGLAKEEFQNEFNVIYNWTVQNIMPFDVDKCTHVSFTKSSNKFCFNNTEIKLVDTQKVLGITISNDMSWNLHIVKEGLKAKKKIRDQKKHIEFKQSSEIEFIQIHDNSRDSLRQSVFWFKYKRNVRIRNDSAKSSKMNLP